MAFTSSSPGTRTALPLPQLAEAPRLLVGHQPIGGTSASRRAGARCRAWPRPSLPPRHHAGLDVLPPAAVVLRASSRAAGSPRWAWRRGRWRLPDQMARSGRHALERGLAEDEVAHRRASVASHPVLGLGSGCRLGTARRWQPRKRWRYAGHRLVLRDGSSSRRARGFLSEAVQRLAMVVPLPSHDEVAAIGTQLTRRVRSNRGLRSGSTAESLGDTARRARLRRRRSRCASAVGAVLLREELRDSVTRDGVLGRLEGKGSRVARLRSQIR